MHLFFSVMSRHHNTMFYWFKERFATFPAPKIGKEMNHQSQCLYCLQFLSVSLPGHKVFRAQWIFCWHWIWTFSNSLWKQKQHCISIGNLKQNVLRLKNKQNRGGFLHTVGLALSKRKISRFLRFRMQILMLIVWISKINKKKVPKWSPAWSTEHASGKFCFRLQEIKYVSAYQLV